MYNKKTHNKKTHTKKYSNNFKKRKSYPKKRKSYIKNRNRKSKKRKQYYKYKGGSESESQSHSEIKKLFVQSVNIDNIKHKIIDKKNIQTIDGTPDFYIYDFIYKNIINLDGLTNKINSPDIIFDHKKVGSNKKPEIPMTAGIPGTHIYVEVNNEKTQLSIIAVVFTK